MYGTKKKKTQNVDLGKKGSFTTHPGALHEALGIPIGEKIGEERIEKALNSDDPRIRRMAASARGFAAMKHK